MTWAACRCIPSSRNTLVGWISSRFVSAFKAVDHTAVNLNGDRCRDAPAQKSMIPLCTYPVRTAGMCKRHCGWSASGSIGAYRCTTADTSAIGLHHTRNVQVRTHGRPTPLNVLHYIPAVPLHFAELATPRRRRATNRAWGRHVVTHDAASFFCVCECDVQ